MTGGQYYVKRKDYKNFSCIWSRQTNRHTQFVVMDLAATDCHGLMFDIDFKAKDECEEILYPLYDSILPLIQSNLKMLLLPLVKHFTYIIAVRSHSHGVHVHIPECIIGHDDYILLCQQLKLDFDHTIRQGHYQLDIPINMTLPGAAKEHQQPYKPLYMIYVDEKYTYEINFEKCLDQQLILFQKNFKRVRDNIGSCFRQLLFLSRPQAEQYVCQYMMPVPTPFKPLYKLTFETIISNKPNESEDHHDVATCLLRHSNETIYICKGKHVLLTASHFLKACHYLKLNTFQIESMDTANHALKKWYTRSQRSHPSPNYCNPIFEELNGHLRASNTNLFSDMNPIKTILEFDHGYYFLPVFYTLCNCLHISSSMMVNHLRGMLDATFIPLLDRIELVDESHTESIMKDFTEQTLFFCGNNLGERFERNRDKLKQMVHDSKRAILSVNSIGDLATLVRNLQESHFPIQMLRLTNSLKKCVPYIWNCLTESWQEMNVEKEKDCHVTNLWNAIKTWLIDYRKAGNTVGGPDEEIIKNFHINMVLSMITSDSSMERKMVQMDRHKWFIRTQDGLLDILTGHVGGTVPELFLSDRKLGVEIPRAEMDVLFNHSKDLVALYELQTQKPFFQKYLKSIFTDQTDDLYHSLRELILERMPDVLLNPYATSMLHFYVHLCKYTAFEYDLLMYLLDVLASIFIATNYERKFFVFKGETSNGKSKLFEILGRMFGGYYHCIQSDNLKPGNSSTNASPDLASTLFNCRIVTTEELEGKLNENRVKQITGNSCVVFRNMYEASHGGIPTAKLFTTTNNLPDCQSTEAFQDRVVAIPFVSRFVNKAPTTTSEQVRMNRYSKDEYVIEQSYMGCFLILSYHLQKHMDVRDGLLHCRETPPSVVEFTQIYLYNTNVYNQFKTYMDVQPSTDCMTTMTDLRSAVRQFLKSTKNNTTAETHLILKFEEEFKDCRKTDESLGNFQYTSVLDQDADTSLEPKSKKRKTNLVDNLIYYENVTIRNLRRFENN